MDNFTERMLERTQRRQELLASASKEKSIPEAISIMSTTVETTKPTKSVIQPIMSPPSDSQHKPFKSPPLDSQHKPIMSITKSPPLCSQRRARLAELASRVDQWLEEDQVLKPIEKNVTDNKPKPQIKPTQPEQIRHLKSPEVIKPPMQDSPNLAASTMTVAQRRALFEQNAGIKKLDSKPKTTTIVTISMTKTTPAVTNALAVSKEENNEPVSEIAITTPPRPIPSSLSTPPSRRGTRPRMSPAIAATINGGNLSPQKARVWTPPCIKNVLLKKQLNKELDDNSENTLVDSKGGSAVVTSSPLDSAVVSPADRIAMSVGRVRFKSPSPSASLYPDLSMIEDDNDQNDEEMIKTPVENQFVGGKKRNNHALNSSTASAKSVPEDDEHIEISGAKRSRCEPNFDDKIHNVSTSEETITTKTSLASPTTMETSTSNDCNNSSMLSGLTSDSPMSLKSTSFTYYPNTDRFPCSNDKDKSADKCSSNNQPTFITPSKQIDEPPLIHSVSVYRKKQQMLRSGGTPSSKSNSKLGQVESLFHQKKLTMENEEETIDEEDDEDYEVQELESAAARAWFLERTVVPEQDRIIEQATQALNICDVYRQRSGLRSESSSKFSPEHVHAERLLLIAGLRRRDAVLEAQRLRVERTLLPDGDFGKKDRHLKMDGDGKTLVIESLRVPLLASVTLARNKHNATERNKYSAIEGMENQTRWPGGYRYFVCVVRAAATVHRPPMIAATRPADALEESVRRFSVDIHCSDDGINYGYVEFITKKHVNKSSGTKKCAMPSESEGAPIMINGLNKDGWKVTVELYGLSPIATGDLENHNSHIGKDHHDAHETKSVLDKLWSTVKNPSKDSKKHHGITGTTCIESPGGPSAVRNTVFRQLGYFIFSDGQVERQQFTLTKVHHSTGISSMTKGTADETVRVRMRLLEEGEQYVFEDNESASGNTRKLVLPHECKRTEGFLTLFDDHELRSNPVIDRGPQWHRQSDIGGGLRGGTTLWRRLWFRVEIIDQSQEQQMSDSSDVALNPKNRQLQTIVLRYWLYPEHAEQQRKPLGTIDLGHCIPPNREGIMANVGSCENSEPAAAPASSELCARRNTLRLLLYNTSVNYDDDHHAIKNGVDDPLLLSADTSDERLEWCDTVNAAVNAISEHRKWIKLAEEQEKEYEKQRYRQQGTGSLPASLLGSGKSIGKKKKLYK